MARAIQKDSELAVFEETGAAGQDARPLGMRFSTWLQRLRRLMRRIGRWLDVYYSLSDFNERLIYDLGIEPIDLRKIRDPSRGNAVLRLRRMRKGIKARPLWPI